MGRKKGDGMQFWNRNYHTLDELSAAALRHDREGLVVYFALAAFSDNESVLAGGRTKVERKAIQAREFRTLALDMDVGEGKPYPTQRDAALALADALKKHGLPPPMVVSSGRGLHCYWPLQHVVSVAKWTLTSKQLKAILEFEGVGIDTSKICDPSMVLRPVGTFNRKGTDLPVRVLRTSPVYDFDALAQQISDVSTKVGVQVTTPTKKDAGLLGALLNSDLPPADPLQVALKCAQLKAIAVTSGANALEPLWYATLGVAAFCEESEKTAIAWSQGHPQYDEGKTLAKLSQWKDKATGPTTCARLESLNPGGCNGCQYKGKISAPTQVSIPKQVSVKTSEGEAFLPRSYRISGKRIVRVVEDEVIPVCNYTLLVRNRFFDAVEQKMVAELVAFTEKEGEKILHLPIDILAAGGEKLTAFFYNQNIAPGPFDAHIRNTRQYLMSYLEELQSLVKPTETYSAFGWTDKGTAFVLGSSKHTRDEVRPIQLASSITTDMQKAYISEGDLDKWVNATAYLDEPGMEYHALCLMMGMGAVLYKFSDLEGFLVSMYSPKSGTGKTTVGTWISSIWGNPQLLKIGRTDTLNAVYRTFAQQGNLPAFCDELTTATPVEVSNFAFNVSGGREKRRMDQTARLKETLHWALVAFVSTNQSILAKVQVGKISSEGEQYRMVEYPFHPNAVFNGTKAGTPTGRTILSTLLNNYGLVGPILINEFLKITDLHTLIQRACEVMEKQYKFCFAGNERYVQAGLAVALIAGRLAKRLDLIQFDYNRSMEKGLEYVEYSRSSMNSHRNDAFDVIGMFLTENVGSTIVEKHNTTLSARNFHLPLPRNEIQARFEITTDSANAFLGGRLYLNRAFFNHWCFDKGVDYNDVIQQLHYAGVTAGAERIALGRRSPIVTTALWVYNLDMQHKRFIDVVSAFEQAHKSKLELDVSLQPPA